ncbi:MAG TPA: hypothetical protein VN461_24090 [Vicinamibacteria bacterium]|nr:hypothetical protein [Vicinamibacteria bacterium]
MSIPQAILASWLGLTLLAPSLTWSQEPPNPETPPAERPGLFHFGPLYVTPYFHIGNVGLDTNVFYSATGRQTDVTATGGPGLELLLPLGAEARFRVNGTFDYLYFVRTASQRRWNDSGDARLEFKTGRSEGSVVESYARTFTRPNLEVDQRVLQTTEMTQLDLKRRLFGRISLTIGGLRSKADVDAGQLFLGTNLRATLSRDEYRAAAGLGYGLTVKTSFVIEADQQWDRFPFDTARDADSNRFAAGFRTDETALISGRLLGGVRLLRPKALPGTEKQTPYADVDATLNVSKRTKISGSYSRDLVFSAFAPEGPTPTVTMEVIGARIEKFLGDRVDLKLYARETHLVTDGAIIVVIPGQAPVVAVRDDRAREAGVDLGYFFRPQLRMGVAASYIDRHSTISYFGISGLLVGGTVQYNPGRRLPW